VAIQKKPKNKIQKIFLLFDYLMNFSGLLRQSQKTLLSRNDS